MSRSDSARPPKEEREPARLEVTEPAPGVLRIQLPIWMPQLGHVNAYLLEDRAGFAIVDPGMPGSWRALRRGVARAGFAMQAAHTVIVTHSHPDHFGGATRLMKHAGAALVTHEDFGVWWKPSNIKATGRARFLLPAIDGSVPWRRVHGRRSLKRRFTRATLRLMASRIPTPIPTRTVADGAALVLGDTEWQAIHTPGHTTDHLCLYRPATGTLISGDHVLPTITPHVSGMAEGDPLGSYLASLHRVISLGRVHHVLPAHGHPFADLTGRVAEIERHHQDRLAALAAASSDLGPATVAALSRKVFPRVYWGFMAESETYAHLEHLRVRGKAERRDETERILYSIEPVVNDQ